MTLQTTQAAVQTAREQQLAEFKSRADAELTKLLPEIDAVRAEKEDMARAAASMKRLSQDT